MQKNDLVKWEGSLYRILVLQDNEVLTIDCMKRTMPIWHQCALMEASEKRTEAAENRYSELVEKFTGAPDLPSYEAVTSQNEALKEEISLKDKCNCRPEWSQTGQQGI